MKKAILLALMPGCAAVWKQHGRCLQQCDESVSREIMVLAWRSKTECVCADMTLTQVWSLPSDFLEVEPIPLAPVREPVLLEAHAPRPRM